MDKVPNSVEGNGGVSSDGDKMDPVAEGPKVNNQEIPVETKDISQVLLKKDIDMRLGLPMKIKGITAWCPICTLRCDNLWKCNGCQTDFPADVQLHNSEDLKLKEHFIPKFIKIEDEEQVEADLKVDKNEKKEGQPPAGCSSNSVIVNSEDKKVKDLKSVVRTPLQELKKKDSQQSSRRSTKSDSREHTKWVETRVRIIPGDSPSRKTFEEVKKQHALQTRPCSSSLSKIYGVVKNSDTVVEEIVHNGTPRILRLTQLHRRGVKLLLSDDLYNKNIEEVVFGGPCSMEVIENVLASLKRARSVKFGHHSVVGEECDGNPGKSKKEHLNNTRMSSFEVKIDRREYNDLSEESKINTKAKIIAILQLATECYPNLNECKVYVPLDGDVERALDTLAHKSGLKGLKTVDYEKLVISYSLQTSTSPPKINNIKEVGEKKEGKVITVTNNVKAVKEPVASPKITCATLKKLRNKRNFDEVICLSSDSDDEGEPKPKIPSQGRHCSMTRMKSQSSETQSSSSGKSSVTNGSEDLHVPIKSLSGHIDSENMIESLIKKFGENAPQDVGAFTHFKFESVQIGHYKCTSAFNKLFVTRYGLLFSIPPPDSQKGSNLVKVGIPEEMITKVTIVAELQTCTCIIVETSGAFENWMQKALDLSFSDGQNLSSSEANQYQRNIIFHQSSISSSISISLLKSIFASKIHEVDYDTARKLVKYNCPPTKRA